MMVLALIILVGTTALLIVASYTYGQNNSEDSMRELLSGVIPQTVTVLKRKGRRAGHGGDQQGRAGNEG